MLDISEFLYTGASIPVGIGVVDTVRVEELLGSGGFGMVCRVRDADSGRIYALKIIRNINAADERVRQLQLVERIRLEAALDIDSPYIVRALGIREWDSHTHFVLFDHFEGRPLRELLARGAANSLDHEARREIVRQMCQGVADAHRCNVIHRDLKPDNILVDARGRTRVIDFGISKFGDRHITRDGTFFGTVPYMAPELLTEGSSRADTRTDIYALGHIIYEMAMGAHFWRRSGWNGIEDFAAYLRRVPPPEGAIEMSDFACDFLPEAAPVVARMTRVAPAQRFPTVLEVLAALRLDCAAPDPPPFHDDLSSPLLIVETGTNANARTVLGLEDGQRREIGRVDVAGDDSSISRRHIAIARRGPSYWLRDLGSRNGTLLGGVALDPEVEVPLRPGDRIKLGEVFMRFAVVPSADGGMTT